MANALDLLNPVPTPPAPKQDGTQSVSGPTDQGQTWDKATAMAPVAGLGGIGLDQSMWQGGPNLYHATRPAQDVPQPIPEDVLWGTTGKTAPAILSAPAAPDAAAEHLAKVVGGDQDQAKAFVATLGQNVVSNVASHGDPGGNLPVQGANQAAAAVLARFKSADEQGKLAGEGFTTAKETLHRMGSGVQVSLQDSSNLVQALTNFEDATQWMPHPEMALHPLVGVDKIHMDAAGVVKVTLNVQGPDGELPADRLAKAAQQNPTALVDYARAHLTSDWQTKGLDEGDIKRWKKTKTSVDQTSSLPQPTLDAAYRLAGHSLGMDPEAVKGLLPVDDSKLAPVTDVPQPIDWTQMAGTLDPVDLKTFGQATADKTQIEVQPDGTQRLLGSWARPLRGLAPSPATSDGLVYMVPSEPANIESVKSATTAMDWNGFQQAIKPGSRLRIDAGGSDPESQHRQFLASLNKAGISPTSVGYLQPVTINGEGHLPLSVEFQNTKDMHDAVGSIADAYVKPQWTAYVDGPGAAPPGSHPAFESWSTDKQGRWGSSLQPSPDLHSVSVYTFAEPSMPNVRIDAHATVVGTQPTVEVKSAPGQGPFAVEVNGTKPTKAWLYIQPDQKPAIFYGPGQPPVDGALPISDEGGKVNVKLPDLGDGKVDPVAAARAQSLLSRLGVENVGFST